jgi:hypothetical protein
MSLIVENLAKIKRIHPSNRVFSLSDFLQEIVYNFKTLTST